MASDPNSDTRTRNCFTHARPPVIDGSRDPSSRNIQPSLITGLADTDSFVAVVPAVPAVAAAVVDRTVLELTVLITGMARGCGCSAELKKAVTLFVGLGLFSPDPV